LAVFDKNQFFFLVMTILIMVFSVVILGVVLSFIRTSPPRGQQALSVIHVFVHEDSDRTYGISEAEVVLTLPDPVAKHTDANGSTSIFFPSGLADRKFDLNARKDGYK